MLGGASRFAARLPGCLSCGLFCEEAVGRNDPRQCWRVLDCEGLGTGVIGAVRESSQGLIIL
jgi:hypothetical protein